MEERGAVLHGLVAVEGSHHEDAVLCELLGSAADRCRRLTVAVVAEPDVAMTLFCPIAGVSVCEVREEAVARACRAAGRAAGLAPEDVCVDHRAFPTWRCLLEAVRREGHDLVLLGGPPRRWADRRLLRRHLGRPADGWVQVDQHGETTGGRPRSFLRMRPVGFHV